MSNSENSPPPEQRPPSRRNPKSNDNRRPERQQSSNLFWYLVIGLVFAFVAFTMVGRQRQGEEIKFSQFMQDVHGGLWTSSNVHEMVVGPGEIRFQNKPQSEAAAEDGEKAETYFIPTVGIAEEQQAALTALLSEKGIQYTGERPPSEWQSLAYFFAIPLMFLLFFIFLFRRMGGAGTAMSFGRSRGRLYAQEEIEITFSDVAGIDEAKDELREVVEFLKTPSKYQALGGRIPRGVLLVGPPGTGKTLLAKAVAGEAGVPFFSLSGSDFVEMFVGVGAARVRDMFQQAMQRAPAIIFIDELDALGKVRGSGMPGGHDEREQTLNALLVEMDGFASDQSVIVMGATNRPETLDPALMRPGRFDRHVLVDRPDINGREEILKVHAAKVKLDDHVDLRRIAKLTPGFVGADLANLVNEAALLAARKDLNKVPMECFEDGIERVMAGLEKQSKILHEEVKQRVAYHECGHALVACTLPHTDPVHKISIIPRGMGALGYTLQLPEDDRQLHTQAELENRVAVLLGGIAAEQIVYQETSTGAQNDLQRATDISRRMVTDFGMSPKLGLVFYGDAQRSAFLPGAQAMTSETVQSAETVREIDLEVKRIVDEMYHTAFEILSQRRELLEHMTRELIECEVMNADRLDELLAEHKTGPQIKPGTFAAPTSETRSPEAGSSDSAGGSQAAESS